MSVWPQLSKPLLSPRSWADAPYMRTQPALASCKDRRAFLHESSTPLVIIGTVKTRLDGTLDHSEVTLGLCLEEFGTREFGSPYGKWRVGADHGRVVLHI